MISVSNKEYFEYARLLEDSHILFYKIWELGVPTLSTTVETAAIAFNEDGEQIDFLFNPDFWEKSSSYERLFVICHEMLHVILNHGFRIKDLKDKSFANKPLDVVVNHMLVDTFGFDRSKLSFEKDLCWIDTIWKNDSTILPKQNFEYYYNLLKVDNNNDASSQKLVDDHSGFYDQGLHEKIKNSVFKNSNQFEVDEILSVLDSETKEEVLAGIGAGSLVLIAENKNVSKKKKWETVIQKWSKKYLNNNSKEEEQWARLDRRLSFLKNTNMFLPSNMEIDSYEESKINVWFFQDTSGSCKSFANRFFNAAKSLPNEKFEVKMHCFDTKVYETTIESRRLYGFGGTSFDIIEDYIQSYIKKNNLKYPEAVFIITDGCGNSVNPQIPKNWYWFLSKNYITYIPKESNKFYLKDFE